MTDIYETVKGIKTPSLSCFPKSLDSRVISHVNRRLSDKLLRETVAKDYEAQYQRISSLQRELITSGGLAQVGDLEASAIKIRQFIDRVKTASYGYAGLFDAIKKKMNWLKFTNTTWFIGSCQDNRQCH